MAGKIRGEQIKDESIDSVDIASGSIKAGELGAQAISGQTAITSVDTSNDYLMIWDATDSALKKVAPTHLGLGTATAAGSDTQLQYNNGGSFGGATKLIYDDSNHRLGVGSTSSPSNILSVYGNVSDAYVAVIDNDQSSNGHVLKLLTDGNGSGSRILEMEDGDGDIVFRARADGRFGFGPDGVDSMGAGTFVVGIDNSSHTADIAISQRLQHLGDSNTYLDFPAADQVQIVAGGVDMLHITEDDSQDKIVFNEGGADVNFIVKSPNESKALYLHAGNEVFHINHGGSNFQTKIHNTNDLALTVNSTGVVLNDDGHATNDFRVESDNNTHMLFVDAGSDKIGINDSDPISELSVAGKISITSESSTPSAPADGHGWLYTKSDGKIYWQSSDVSETDLTSGGSGGSSETAVSYTLGYSTLNGSTSGNVSDALTIPSGKTVKIITVDIDTAFVDGSGSGMYATMYLKIGNAYLMPRAAYSSYGSVSEGTAFWGSQYSHGVADCRITTTSETDIALYWANQNSTLAAGSATIKAWYV